MVLSACIPQVRQKDTQVSQAIISLSTRERAWKQAFVPKALRWKRIQEAKAPFRWCYSVLGATKRIAPLSEGKARKSCLEEAAVVIVSGSWQGEEDLHDCPSERRVEKWTSSKSRIPICFGLQDCRWRPMVQQWHRQGSVNGRDIFLSSTALEDCGGTSQDRVYHGCVYIPEK